MVRHDLVRRQRPAGRDGLGAGVPEEGPGHGFAYLSIWAPSASTGKSGAHAGDRDITAISRASAVSASFSGTIHTISS